jgi:general stress protein 26
MNHEDYQKAAAHWKLIDAKSQRMDPEKLGQAIRAYIQANNTCALATGAGDFVRCTPIEYSYLHGAFWMFSEGGEKFIALEKNKNVCLVIYDKYQGFAGLKGMQIMGVAAIVEPFSEEYNRIASEKKIPLEALKKLPEPMNLIKVTPKRIDFLNSDFKKEGYSSRQELLLE